MENLYRGLIDLEEYSISIDDVVKLYVYTDILKIAGIPIHCQRHFEINNKLVREYVFRFQEQEIVKNSRWVDPKDFDEDGLMILGNMPSLQKVSDSRIEIALADSNDNQIFFLMNDSLLYDCSLFDDELCKNLVIFMLTVKTAIESRVLFCAFYTKDVQTKEKLRVVTDTVEFGDANLNLYFQSINVFQYRILQSSDYAKHFFKNKQILKGYIASLADYPVTTHGLDIINRRAVDLFNELFQGNENATLEDRKFFFRGVDKATGPVAYTQRGSDFLLTKLKKLCQRLHIDYWLYYGTLLGAKRHNAFIPWDDDIDIGVMREDLHKIIRYLQNDGNFSIDILYNTEWGDRVYKFRFKNSDLPAYVDIFPFDYCQGDSSVIWESFKGLKHDLVTDFRKLQEELGCGYHVCFKIPENHLVKINNLFDKYRKIAYKKIHLSEKKTDKIVYGFDNVFLFDWQQVFSLSEITPFSLENFNGTEHPVFCNAEEVLIRNYVAPYTLPNDIVSHRHTARMSAETQQKMSELMSALQNYEFV